MRLHYPNTFLVITGKLLLIQLAVQCKEIEWKFFKAFKECAQQFILKKTGCEERSGSRNVLLNELLTVAHSVALGHLAAHQGNLAPYTV